jgi:hypothetical protein
MVPDTFDNRSDSVYRPISGEWKELSVTENSLSRLGPICSYIVGSAQLPESDSEFPYIVMQFRADAIPMPASPYYRVTHAWKNQSWDSPTWVV